MIASSGLVMKIYAHFLNDIDVGVYGFALCFEQETRLNCC